MMDMKAGDPQGGGSLPAGGGVGSKSAALAARDPRPQARRDFFPWL